MGRKENIMFLKNSYRSKTKKEPKGNFEELCDWYFSNTERSVKVCAHRAYNDLCRTLTGISKMPESNTWRENIEQCIAEGIDEILQNKSIKKSVFDEWHRCVCDKIINKSSIVNDYIAKRFENGFTYGLSQKWLNMTLKYIIIMELFNERMQQLLPLLHVPVDSYIIDAAWKESSNIILPLKDEKTNRRKEYVHPSEYITPWSQWNDYGSYLMFQNSLAQNIGKKTPFEWECESWLKEKDYRDNRSKK